MHTPAVAPPCPSEALFPASVLQPAVLPDNPVPEAAVSQSMAAVRRQLVASAGGAQPDLLGSAADVLAPLLVGSAACVQELSHQQLAQHKQRLVQGTLLGLHSLQRRQRLPREAAKALLRFIGSAQGYEEVDLESWGQVRQGGAGAGSKCPAGAAVPACRAVAAGRAQAASAYQRARCGADPPHLPPAGVL